jgi:hypothetical protein
MANCTKISFTAGLLSLENMVPFRGSVLVATRRIGETIDNGYFGESVTKEFAAPKFK